MNYLGVLIALSTVALATCQLPPLLNPSITTASGFRAPPIFQSGSLIFEDTFQEFDMETWQHENTLAGGGNWEFQWYANNRSNSYTEDGTLHLVPTLVADEFGEGFLSSGVLNLHGGSPADQCTNPSFFGCERGGNAFNILNPIKSARVRTVNSFAFRYGTVEVRAKLPAGDWLWPAIWLMPKNNVYGTWPSSGEIDLMESRGNRRLFEGDVNVGVERSGSTLHFGPRFDVNGWPTAHFNRNQQPGYNEDFHVYRLIWTNESITFQIDNDTVGVVEAGAGFWARGGFEETGRENPWRRSNSLMAPFDQEFYLIINLAVGGVNFFPDNFVNEGTPKPWTNDSPRAQGDFWDGRNGWLPTWNMDTDDSHLQIDYVRVWAL
ncbi:CLUMA_CG009276, isoform A [Clunio marinus]|uniref:CLUMA_CG009276, isoform A n=1 Tax=Clunio marinus TaxID=568069 RepID=A0A1J1I6C9_9DIPT|nr:CLUMA_CG009276, isoform A [Clunio marinus]